MILGVSGHCPARPAVVLTLSLSDDVIPSWVLHNANLCFSHLVSTLSQAIYIYIYDFDSIYY